MLDMSLNRTPIRNPLREVKSLNNTPEQRSNITPHKCLPKTPKMSPGPALLLGIKLSLSAKKDLKKLVPCELSEDKENASHTTVDSNQDVMYFRNLLSSETSRITTLCEKWDGVLLKLQSKQEKDDDVDAYSSIMGDIRTTIGQGRLIMRERFHQFSGLVDNCEFHTSEKPVTCQDLQGFWDMIYFQVEDVDAKFSILEKCRASDWNPEVLRTNNAKTTPGPKVVKKKFTKKASAKPSAAVKSRQAEFAKKRAEARKRLAAAKAAMKEQQELTKEPTIVQEKERVTFDAGFFKVDSPIKSPHINKNKTPSGACLRKQLTTPSSAKQGLSPCTPHTAPRSLPPPESLSKKESVEITKKLEFHADVREEAAAKQPDFDKQNSSKNIPTVSVVITESMLVDTEKEYSNMNVTSAVNVKIAPETENSNGPGNGVSSTHPKTGSPSCTDMPSPSLAPKEPPSAENEGVSTPISDSFFPLAPPTPFNSTLIQSPVITSEIQVVKSRESDFHSPKTIPDKVTKPHKIDKHVEGSIAKCVGTTTQVTNTPICEKLSAKENLDSELDISEMGNLSIFMEEASKNIEKVSQILHPARHDLNQTVLQNTPSVVKQDPKVNSLVRIDEGTSTTPSLGAKTKPANDTSSVLQETLEKILSKQEMLERNVVSIQDNFSENKCKSPKSVEDELHTSAESLKNENISLRRQLEVEKMKNACDVDVNDPDTLRKLLFKTQGTTDAQADGAYESHYCRLLAQVKVLQSELAAFQNLQPDLDRVKGKLVEAFSKLNKKTKTIGEYSREVKKRENEVEKTKEWENMELDITRKRIEDLESEVTTLKAKLEESESIRREESSSLDALQDDLNMAKIQLNEYKTETEKLHQENGTLNKQKDDLEEKLDIATVDLKKETERAEKLETKMNTVCAEIKSAISSFEAEVKKRDEIIASQDKQQKELATLNEKLSAESTMLQDKVGTFEYLEDERQSLQDQLTETEQILESSRKQESQMTVVISELKSKIAGLEKEINENREKGDRLQEELDETKVASQLAVLEKEEELLNGNEKMKDILQLMQGLHMRLCEMIKSDGDIKNSQSDLLTPHCIPSDSKSLVSSVLKRHETSQGGSRQLKSIYETPATALTNRPCALSSLEEPNKNGTEMSEETQNETCDSISGNAEKGIQLFQSIVKACEVLQAQFHQEKDDLVFKNSVLSKQLAATKEKLSNSHENDKQLEQLLRDRISRLTKENEEKEEKLESKAQSIKKLSDQIMELYQCKIEYQKMLNDKMGRRGRYPKRRSSSAGSLKFLP